MKSKTSRIVIVNRTSNFTPAYDKKDARTTEWNAISNRQASVRNISASNTKPYTGLGFKSKDSGYDYALELDSIKLLFPSIVGMDYNASTAVEFRSKVNQYYEALTMSIPAEGKEFEIGLENSNHNLISIDNMPISPIDYIRFKALFENTPSYVADNETEGNGVSSFFFYLTYKSEEEKNKLEKAELGATAQAYYTEVKDTADVKFILRELALPYDKDNTIKNSLTLVDFSTNNPARFIKEIDLFKENKQKYRSRLFIKNCIQYELISKRSNDEYRDVASDIVIAVGIVEMTDYMVNPLNKEAISRYKNMLQEKTME
jgi:hypothetical protein